MLIYDTWITNVRALLVAANIAGTRITRHRETPTRDDQLPACDLFIADDDGRPSGGSGRIGLPQFDHVTKLGIEIRDGDNSGQALRTKLHAEAQKVFEALLPTWPDWLVDGEGIGGIRTAFDIPPDAGEVTGRVMIQIDLLSQSIWALPSTGLPAFATTSVDTGIPAGETTIGTTIAVPVA